MLVIGPHDLFSTFLESCDKHNQCFHLFFFYHLRGICTAVSASSLDCTWQISWVPAAVRAEAHFVPYTPWALKPRLHSIHVKQTQEENRLTKSHICLPVLQAIILIYCINNTWSGSTQLYVVYTDAHVCVPLCDSLEVEMFVFVPSRDPFHTQDKHNPIHRYCMFNL